MDGRLACGKLLDSHFRTNHGTTVRFCDNGNNWPPLFADAAHVCVYE